MHVRPKGERNKCTRNEFDRKKIRQDKRKQFNISCARKERTTKEIYEFSFLHGIDEGRKNQNRCYFPSE